MRFSRSLPCPGVAQGALPLWLLTWLFDWLLLWLFNWLLDCLSTWLLVSLLDWLCVWLSDSPFNWLVDWLLTWLLISLRLWLSLWLPLWLPLALPLWLRLTIWLWQRAWRAYRLYGVQKDRIRRFSGLKTRIWIEFGVRLRTRLCPSRLISMSFRSGIANLTPLPARLIIIRLLIGSVSFSLTASSAITPASPGVIVCPPVFAPNPAPQGPRPLRRCTRLPLVAARAPVTPRGEPTQL